MKSTTPLQTLEAEISAVRRYPVNQIVSHWTALILDNPNGLAGRVVTAYSKINPEVSRQLSERIDPETGLLTYERFRERIHQEIQNREFNRRLEKETGKTRPAMPATYVLVIPDDFEAVKAHIMQNPLAPTRRTIGRMGEIIGVLFPYDLPTTQKAMARYAMSTVLVEYKPGMTVEQMHEEAKVGIRMTINRRINGYESSMQEQRAAIELALLEKKDASSMIDHYMELATSYGKQRQKIDAVLKSMQG